MENKGHWKGIIAALSSAIFLGIAPIFGKQAINLGFSPLAIVTLRSGIAVLLVTFGLLIWKRKYFYIYPVGLIGCLAAGIVNGIGSILYYTSLSRLDAGIGQLIYSFYPLFVAMWLFLDRQPINKVTLIRLGISLPGAYLLISAAENKVDWLGAVLMLGASILYGLHLIINQRILYEVPSQTVTFYTLLAMTITVSIPYLIFDRRLPLIQSTWSSLWWPIIGMGVLMFLSRITLFAGVKRLGGMQTALLGLGEIIVTVVLSIVFLNEHLSILQWVGAVLLLANIFLGGFDKPTPQKRYSSGVLAWLNPPQINPSDFQ